MKVEKPNKGRGYPITSADDVTPIVGTQKYMTSDGTGRIVDGETSAPNFNVKWMEKVKMTGEEEDDSEAQMPQLSEEGYATMKLAATAMATAGDAVTLGTVYGCSVVEKGSGNWGFYIYYSGQK